MNNLVQESFNNFKCLDVVQIISGSEEWMKIQEIQRSISVLWNHHLELGKNRIFPVTHLLKVFLLVKTRNPTLAQKSLSRWPSGHPGITSDISQSWIEKQNTKKTCGLLYYKIIEFIGFWFIFQIVWKAVFRLVNAINFQQAMLSFSLLPEYYANLTSGFWAEYFIQTF